MEKKLRLIEYSQFSIREYIDRFIKMLASGTLDYEIIYGGESILTPDFSEYDLWNPERNKQIISRIIKIVQNETVVNTKVSNIYLKSYSPNGEVGVIPIIFICIAFKSLFNLDYILYTENRGGILTNSNTYGELLLNTHISRYLRAKRDQIIVPPKEELLKWIDCPEKVWARLEMYLKNYINIPILCVYIINMFVLAKEKYREKGPLILTDEERKEEDEKWKSYLKQ